MKFKYTGDDDQIILRGVTFAKGKAVEVDPLLAAKVSVLPYFQEVKAKPNANKK